MKASSLSFLAAVIAAVTGMAWGLIMGISENHVTMPAHAHLNLLGWVSLFLIGIFITCIRLLIKAGSRWFRSASGSRERSS